MTKQVPHLVIHTWTSTNFFLARAARRNKHILNQHDSTFQNRQNLTDKRRNCGGSVGAQHDSLIIFSILVGCCETNLITHNKILLRLLCNTELHNNFLCKRPCYSLSTCDCSHTIQTHSVRPSFWFLHTTGRTNRLEHLLCLCVSGKCAGDLVPTVPCCVFKNDTRMKPMKTMHVFLGWGPTWGNPPSYYFSSTTWRNASQANSL